MKKFLICSCDESVVDYPPSFVIAETEDKAMQKFLREVYSKNDIFRSSVLDLAANMTFVEQFYFSNERECRRFDNKKKVVAEKEIVKNRVERFFSTNPNLGKLFVRYMETRDASLISDDVFEFIATSESKERHGHVALDVDFLNTV
ncbi:hypothetical protein [Duganella qianjiadongensis]|uniref:Uncharacterized protein n=1 Tax=Duganella qianjiadongensis TaxID=2692176 RepID=A0ABW9VKK8_9BURK|nr:hypothetical protein [Duganella qianjiadongensis]MYM39450.1 hypothetical protein [Duganella qianjiadongensis]